MRHIFGYPGGAIMPVYDALVGSTLTHILVRHEQGAALAADAYGRVTGEPGVCLATSGPGATNLVTGIANAFLDSVPMVAITGQVGSHLMGTDAFQEVDIFGITLPIVKHSYVVRDPDGDSAHLRRGVRSGPLGPAGAGADRPAQGRDACAPPRRRARRDARRSSSCPTPDGGAIARANALIEAAQGADPLFRRRCPHCPRRACAARVRAAHRTSPRSPR